MNDYSISLGLALPGGAGYVIPNVAGVIQKLAMRACDLWMAYAGGTPLPNGMIVHSRTGNYLRSIQLRQLGEFSWEVFSDCAYARAIEYGGTEPYDMHKMLATSMKVRRTNDGRKYLIIPFRWGTPGTVGFGKSTMPLNAYPLLKALEPSRVTGMGSRVSGQDGRTMVPQASYAWGGRVSKQSLLDAGVDGRTARNMAGMVKFQSPTSKGSKDTQYLTFRVLSEGSGGWIRPAIPGKHVAEQVSQKIQTVADKLVGEALLRGG